MKLTQLESIESQINKAKKIKSQAENFDKLAKLIHIPIVDRKKATQKDNWQGDFERFISYVVKTKDDIDYFTEDFYRDIVVSLRGIIHSHFLNKCDEFEKFQIDASPPKEEDSFREIAMKESA